MANNDIVTPDLERRVRSNDPDTSWAAAAITTEDVRSVRAAVLRIIGAGTPKTDEQIYDAYRAAGGRRTPQRVRTAREELANPKAGDPKVKVAALEGLSAAGHPARRWELA